MRLLLLWCALALVTACATPAKKAATSDPKKRNAADYYPTAIGTRWKYTGTMFGDKGLEVTMVKHEDGFAFDSTGAQFAVDQYGVRDQKRYLLRNPLEVGTKWSNVVSPSSIERFEIIGINQTCDIPGGLSHECVEVESRNRIRDEEYLVFNYVFAPGVGLVRLGTLLDSKGKLVPQTSMALVDFKPAPAAAAVDAGTPGVKSP